MNIILGQCVSVFGYVEVDWSNEQLIQVQGQIYSPVCVIKRIFGNLLIVQNIDTKEEYITSSDLVMLKDRRKKERRK